MWDVVGGHLEAGETPREALVRECREELGVEVLRTGEPYVVDLGNTRLWVFAVLSWQGEPVNAAPEEHEFIGWFDLDALPVDDLADPRLTQVIRLVLSVEDQAQAPGG